MRFNFFCVPFLLIFFSQTSFSFQKEVKELGELIFVSKTPNPKEINYPNCNFSTIFLTSKNERFNVIFRGIQKNKLLEASKLKKGDKLSLNLIPFEKVSSEIKQMQLADYVDDFDLPIYFAKQYSKIKSYKKNKVKYVKKKIKKNKITILPKEKDAIKARKKSIKKDLKSINKIYKKTGKRNWGKWYSKTFKQREEYMNAFKRKEKKWVNDAYFSAGKAFSENKEGNFVEAMIEFKNYLDNFNIDLLIVRIPFKGEICADLFLDNFSQDKIIDPYVTKITKELLNNNIEVLNLNPRLIEERFKTPLTFFYNDFDESHPAEQVSRVAADEIAKRLERYNFFEDKDNSELKLIKKESRFRNSKTYKWPTGNENFSSKESILYSSIINEKEQPVRFSEKSNSKILIVGNSFLSYPSEKKGASISHYFNYISNIKPDVFFRSGASGFGRLIFKKGENFLEGKKVLVYIVHPQNFQRNVAMVPTSYKFNSNDFIEEKLKKISKENWFDIDYSSTPHKLVKGAKIKSQKEFLVIGKILQMNSLKPNRKGIGKGGSLKLRLENKKLNKESSYIKLTIKFAKIAFGHVEVIYNEKVKNLMRTLNRSDKLIEEVYFKVDNNKNEIDINFLETRNNRPLQIESIEINILKRK